MANVKGNELYRLLIQLTGLEPEKVQSELDPLLAKLNMCPTKLTMDDVRKAMLQYLDEYTSQLASDELETFRELEALEDSERVEA